MVTYRKQRKCTTSANDHSGRPRMHSRNNQLLPTVYAGMGGSGMRPRNNVHPRTCDGNARRCYRKGREDGRNDRLDLWVIAIALMAILMVLLAFIIGILSRYETPAIEQMPEMVIADKELSDDFVFDGQRYVIIQGVTYERY